MAFVRQTPAFDAGDFVIGGPGVGIVFFFKGNPDVLAVLWLCAGHMLSAIESISLIDCTTYCLPLTSVYLKGSLRSPLNHSHHSIRGR